MKIEILGAGCASCVALFENVKKIVAEEKMMAQIEKVDDIAQIMKYNVISTPALVINGEVKSTGKSLTLKELKVLIK